MKSALKLLINLLSQNISNKNVKISYDRELDLLKKDKRN